MNEIWKEIPDYEDKYMVSNLGGLKSLDRYVFKTYDGHKRKYKLKGCLMSRTKDSHGYLTCSLSKNGIRKAFRIHRLVLLAFVGKSDLYVHHKNSIKTDNRLINLEYTTNSENVKKAHQDGLHKIRKGLEHSNTKLNIFQMLTIKTIPRHTGHSNNNYTLTTKDLSKLYGVSVSVVQRIRNSSKPYDFLSYLDN